MSSRREVREKVMQALYAYDVSGSEAKHVIDTVLKPDLAADDTSFKFATKLFLRALDNRDEADRLVEAHVQNWDMGRMALIDRILLRMGITEFLAFEDIPPKVTINEIIEVAKKYSTARSGQFINGVLDAVLLDLEREGRLRKSGRGLVGMQSVRDRIS